MTDTEKNTQSTTEPTKKTKKDEKSFETALSRLN